MLAAAITAFFAALVIAKSFDEFRQRRITLTVFLFWLLAWTTATLVALSPSTATRVQERLFGAETGIGTILGIAYVFLLFLSYRLYQKADRVERDLNRLISDLALRDIAPPTVRGTKRRTRD